MVPDTDAYLLYTNAKEFAQLCHSFELNAGDIQKLKTCAEIIVDLYSSVPDLNITPKFHNILHYWQDAAKFGSIYRNSSYIYVVDMSGFIKVIRDPSRHPKILSIHHFP